MPFKGSFGAKPSKSFRSVLRVFNSFSDSFNRSDNSGLIGLSTSRGFWTTLKGKWITNNGSIGPNNTTDYPIISLDMSSQNVTLSISSDVYSENRASSATVSSVGAGNGTTGSSGYYWGQLSGLNTTSGMSIGDQISATNGTGKVYGGTPDLVEITEIVDANTINFRTKGGESPSNGSVSNVIWSKSQSAGSGLAVWTTDSNNWIGVVNGISADTSCNCSTCLSGTYSCSAYSTGGGGCSTYGRYDAGSSCNGYVNQAAQYSKTTYTTNGGKTYQNTYSKYQGQYCSSYRSNVYTGCIASAGYYNFCSSSSQLSGPCNCQTCYPSYISVIKSVSGVVTELARYSVLSLIGAIKVITNSSTKALTIRAYRDQSMSSQIGSDLSYIDSSLSPTNKFGIVLAQSEQKQGSQVKDFKIDTN